ncbi:MAG: F0F1 ATP synthase subunit B [Candidatus Falkowbacteria bacterium]
MESIISTFHIDWKLLIAQAVNFAIIFFVLYRFAFKPIAKVMQERTETIEKSLQEAKDIEAKLSATEIERGEIIANAKKDALAIMENANKTAEDNRQKLVEKTKDEIAKIIKREKEGIEADKVAMMKELKQDLAELVILATEKVINEKMSDVKDKSLIAEIIK